MGIRLPRPLKRFERVIRIIIDFLNIAGAKHIKSEKADILRTDNTRLNQKLSIEIELTRIFLLFLSGLKAGV